ncbi:hypothetical protein OESDEN_15171 [Oesophagostomum dentatum]|uniref:Uncharacterized protein n=1 Tax=Oesophagostomum dentatum TaxID=61180 RepID=A0A0B1SIE9_OESDE|nr:hypothetical protein OESDEN_15171 [Oesophagostomum dentatum]
MALLLQALAISLLFTAAHSAGKCDLSAPPKSWLTTTGIGIMKWATAGVATNGDNFCITGNPTTVVEVDYHIDLGDDATKKSATVPRPVQELWDNPDNFCAMDDPQIHVCFPFCSTDLQTPVIEAALASGDPATVARTIQRTVNLENWAVTVLQVDFNNPEAHLNASIFADPNVWCSVYIGIDPDDQRNPYLFEIQLAKVIIEQ